MAEFSIGQKVQVEYTGILTKKFDASFGITDQDGRSHTYKRNGSVKITVADPESWPPLVGDVWELNGETFFVISSTYGNVLSFYGDDSRSEFIDSRLFAVNSVNGISFKEAGPVLKYRKPDTGSSCN